MSAFLERSLDDIIGADSSSKLSRSNKRHHISSKGINRNRNNPRHPRNRPSNQQPPRNRRPPFKSRAIQDKEAEEASNGEAYVRVTNLHPEITEKDLIDLFSQIGEISFCKVIYNTKGESIGVGFVVFKEPSNTYEAIEKFDGRKAAGQTISLENAVPLANRISAPPAPRGKKGRRDQKNPRKARKTLDDLDAELNAYMGVETEPAPAEISAATEQAVEEQPHQAQAQAEEQPVVEAVQEPFPAVGDVEMD